MYLWCKRIRVSIRPSEQLHNAEWFTKRESPKMGGVQSWVMSYAHDFHPGRQISRPVLNQTADDLGRERIRVVGLTDITSNYRALAISFFFFSFFYHALVLWSGHTSFVQFDVRTQQWSSSCKQWYCDLQQSLCLTLAWTLHERTRTQVHMLMQKHANICRLWQPCTHVCIAALLKSPCYCLLTAVVLFFLSSPAKICFLSPCGSVYTDTIVQLSEEKQTENWVDKSEELLTEKCFTRWFCSFSPPFHTFLPHVSFFFSNASMCLT